MLNLETMSNSILFFPSLSSFVILIASLYQCFLGHTMSKNRTTITTQSFSGSRYFRIICGLPLMSSIKYWLSNVFSSSVPPLPEKN